MKTITKKTIILSLSFCAVFALFIPQDMDAQVSPEAARLLRSANVQIYDQPVSPQGFTLPFLNGGSASLSSFRGKVVILNFWATWCPPCRAEMPSMEVLYQRFKNQGLEMLAVNLQEDAGTVRQFIQSHRYTFPVMLNIDGRIGSLYGVRGIPTSFIIDRRGMIIGVINGAIHWDTPQVIAAFEALLNSR